MIIRDGTSTVAVAFTIAITPTATVAIPPTADDIHQVTLVVLLYGLLPLTNAMADTVSVAATRRFLRHIGHRDRPGLLPVLLGVIIDLIIAAACLIALLFLITRGLDLWGWLHPLSQPLDWRAYAANIWPLTPEGVAFYLMLLTTLIPTAIHVVAGLGAVAVHRFHLYGHASGMIDALSERERTGEALEDYDLTRIAKRVFAARFFGWVLAGIVITLMIWLIWPWIADGLSTLVPAPPATAA